MAGNPRERGRYAPIFLESLRGGENRSNHQTQAKSAYQRLHTLYEELSSDGSLVALSGGIEVRLRKGKVLRSGYKDIETITAVVIKREGKDSSFVAHFSLSQHGATDFSLPESVRIEGSYTQLYAPEASKPLVAWLLRMKKVGSYISPPIFSVPAPTI